MATEVILGLRFWLCVDSRPQYEIARAAGVSESRLSRLARGVLAPTDDERVRVAQILGRTEHELFSPMFDRP